MIIGKSDAVALLAKAVGLRGSDYIDSNSGSGGGCKYTDGSGPLCLVGMAYHLAGATIGQLRVMDGEGDGSLSIWDLPDDHIPIDTTAAAIRVFGVAQDRQDRGGSWGEALGYARDVASRGAGE